MIKKSNIPEYKVSEFNKSIKDVIESNFNYVRIRGEISEIKPATKGQIYLTLKDDHSVLKGVVWENKKQSISFNPEIGIEVIATGKITTWSRYSTSYQIDIDNLEIAGEGALLKLIEDRKKRLKAKGLFEIENKKTIPFLPKQIGVITSPTGSVIHDIINRIKSRFPTTIYIWPVSVQGSDSANTIINAIQGFNSLEFQDKPDVIIIARGGGSTEDLMSFNDENLAFEVFNSKIPIISAVGHETDTTIIDYVSDLRASTPTAAAEIAVPLRENLINNLHTLDERLNRSINRSIELYKENLFNVSKLIKAPKIILNSYNIKVTDLIKNLNNKIASLIFNKNNFLQNLNRMIKPPEKNIKMNIDKITKIKFFLDNKIINIFNNKNKICYDLIRLLNSNSINSNLKKGYVIVSKSKKILKKSNHLKNQDEVKLKFYDRSINIKIKKIN